jgi:enoyl-[acyl-carrier protein] reductase / trans-2-enoyl-CoA reductase (NAD+)
MNEKEDYQIIKPKIKGFICTTAHPKGCVKSVEKQIHYAQKNVKPNGRFKKALILGASSGFGLASRIVLAQANKASTIGVYLERPPRERRTGSPGYYASRAFAEHCQKESTYSRDFNADGFSTETLNEVASAIRKDLGKIDILVYSLAAPRRTDPETGETHSSVLKPIGQKYESRTMSLLNGAVTPIEIQEATPQEVASTVTVMGGADWRRWIEFLLKEDLLEKDFVSVAYSYIGSQLTYPIYKDGTIGAAKLDLEVKSKEINELLKKVNGKALVSVNKALITQASSAIPVVPLYLSLLYKVMKQKDIHEDCIAQITRLFNDYLHKDLNNIKLDSEGRVRIDDLELREDVQQEVLKLWDQVTPETLATLGDVQGVQSDYLRVFGFDYEEIDYSEAVNIAV